MAVCQSVSENARLCSGWALLLAAVCMPIIIILAIPVGAQSMIPPPIIDRELFFGDPEIVGAQISPDGVFIAFIKPFKGTRNIWVKRTTEPFASAKPITADTARPLTCTSGAATASTFCLRRTRPVMKTSTSTPSIRRIVWPRVRMFQPHAT